MTVLLDVWKITGKIDKSVRNSHVKIRAYSHMLEMWIESYIIFMGTHYDLLKSPIQDDVMAGDEGDIIVTDERGDFFKITTILDGLTPAIFETSRTVFKITNKKALDYYKYNIPTTAYIAFMGAATIQC